jgi:hypothetical protein
VSHFTRVKTQITDREMLVKALADLKYKVAENATVRGYQGNKLTADVVVQPGGAYDIGFEKSADGSYQVVADWWGVEQDTRVTTKAFMEPLTQRYAYHKVVAEVAKQGFQIVQETTGVDQTLKVTVRRWG